MDANLSHLLDDAPSGVRALALALQHRDRGTWQHCLRTGALAGRFAAHLGLPAASVARLGLAGFLHDLGKIGVPDHVLRKGEQLSAEEWPLMRAHAGHGAAIVSALDLAGGGELSSWVESHHERHDGGGYPRGLHGDAIPLGARIISLADSYDAITHARPYRPGSPHEHALELIERDAGRHFEPELARQFVRMW